MNRFRSREEIHVAGGVESSGNIVVDGTSYELEAEPLAPGMFALRHNGRVEVLHCLREGRVIHVAFRGVNYRFEEWDQDAAPAHKTSLGGLEAPMPGRVTALRVRVGQVVSKGEEMLLVEAMKMENALRAPRDGVVAAVHVEVGDAVSPGVVLVELA